ncbi:MAG TPA: PIN domain-containing protein [Caulobacteraceae bacterium]|nr:PIN domain-containing protein [Caulobacteraceae bacterium]
MIAADSSSLINYLRGARTPDRVLVRRAIDAKELWLPPPVKTEIMSGRLSGLDLTGLMENAPLLTISSGFWERAGESRRLILSKGLKAHLADTLIAQCCIDSNVPLIARDGDYVNFERWCGLKLAT